MVPATNKVKIGYEISFNRYFYKPEADADAGRRSALTSLALEQETEGLLAEILGEGKSMITNLSGPTRP